MIHAPRPKAVCTYCAKVRTLMASGKPMPHGARHVRCRGSRQEAQPCPTCNGVRTVRQHAEGHTCDTCKGTGRIVK